VSRCAIAVVAGLALASAVVACGAASRQSAAPPTAGGGVGNDGILPGDPHAQIEQLDADIRANLDRLGVAKPTTYEVGSATDPRPMTDIRRVCTPAGPPSETCGDVCNLGNHICDNADKICELAAELAPDAWAQGKCEDGKRSCEAARTHCCECS